jgi:hypothetical protein
MLNSIFSGIVLLDIKVSVSSSRVLDEFNIPSDLTGGFVFTLGY